MDRNQRVDAGDLEHSQDSRVGGDDAEAPTGVGQRARRSQQYRHPCRVEKRALGKVDHDRIGTELRERVREPGRRRKVELARYVQNGRSGRHRLAVHVKIAGRDHGKRV